MKTFLYLGFIGFLVALAIVPTIVGLYLAFSAHILLGLLALLVEPSPWFIGIIYLVSGHDVCVKIMELFN